MIDPKVFKALLKQYRHDVPTVGIVTQDVVNQLLVDGRICRGWVVTSGERMYFHIVRSPENYPEKTVSYGPSEEAVVTILIYLGYSKGVDFEHLVSDRPGSLLN